MTDNANPAPENLPPGPAAGQDFGNSKSSAAGTQPEVSSLRSFFKTAVPVVILLAVVFGVTFFAQYTPKRVETDTKGSSAGPGNARAEQLRFGSISRRWKPGSLQDEFFPGFYEVSDNWNSASFWLENRNAEPVAMKFTGAIVNGLTRCPTCGGGRFAAIPPDVTDQIIASTILSGLPQGLVNLLPVSVAGPAANLAPNRLDWQSFFYQDNPSASYTIPGAPTSKHLMPYQWGIFELLFRASSRSVSQLTANYSLESGGSKMSEMYLTVVYEGIDPFEIYPKYVNIGEWKETTAPRTFDFYVYSSTRGANHAPPQDRFDPPKVTIHKTEGSGDPGPFVTVEPPTPLPLSEYRTGAREVSENVKKYVRFDTAYRYTITVRPRVGNELADIGPLDREIELTIPGVKDPKTVHVRGTVRGSVWLDNDRTEIELPSYRNSEGIEQTVRIVSEQRDLTIELVKDECQPKFIELQLKRLPPSKDRGYYELKLTIPKNAQSGRWSGSILLDLKGGLPQKMRIPVRGSSTY